MFGLWFLILFLPFLTGTDSAYCNGTSYGTEFIFGFLDLPFYEDNRTALNPELRIKIIPQKYSTDYYVSLESTNSASKTPTIIRTQGYAYSGGKELKFNSTFINRYQDVSTGGVINITSDDPISLMAIYTFRFDANRISVIMYPILPTSVLSSDYVIPSYPPSSNYHGRTQFMVVGVNDSTSIRFEGYETGSMVYDVDHNDIFMYQRRTDISSTSALSNHPVSIFSWITTGDLSSSMNRNANGRSLAMQVPPLDIGAVHFIIPSLSGDSIQYYKVRIYASSKNAFVEIHSTSTSTQYAHVYNKIFFEFTARRSSDIFEIVSDSPIVVVQIALNSYHYPLFMTAIPAVSQFMNSYKVSFPDAYISSCKKSVVIIVPYKEATGLLINGDPIIHDTSSLNKSPLGNYTIITQSASSSMVTVTHAGSQPVGVIALGQWQSYRSQVKDAYGFVPGIQFTSIDCSPVDSGHIVG